MPVIADKDAPRFDAEGTHVVAFASPSRGATDTCVWRVLLDPGASSPEHELEREEVFVALGGTARATIAGQASDLPAGDALIVPAGVPFTLANDGDEPFEAVVCLPVGARATVGGQAFVPPWAA
jgi:mannose-6-phosphate isomerase-like protein (cupin superfamily)